MFTDALAMIETAAREIPPHWPPQQERSPAVAPYEVLGDQAAPAATGAAVSLSGLSKSFGDTPVIGGIDLDIAPGAFVAVVGKSGCGKSTLLRLVLGLETPSSGTISVSAGAAARFVFQEPRLLPWASVADNVAVGLGRTGTRASRRAAAARALAEVGLDGRGAAWPSVLSGGQKQRVALARALVSRPRLLALDEPLGALDALTRIAMQGLVERVWLDQRFTALLVTHDVSEAIALADRVLLVDGGRIALDLAIDLPRPRRRGTPAFAALEKRVLDRLFDGFEDGAAI